MTDRRELRLTNNRLSGRVPAEFKNLSNLYGLGIGKNAGICVPSSLKHMPFFKEDNACK